MKKIIIHIASILLLSMLYVGCTNAQETMRIALKKGYDSNPTVQVDSLTIELVNLFIRSEPWDGRNLSMQLEMNIINSATEEEYTTFLGYYEKTGDELRNTFPKAFGKYLFDLDIRDDGVDLLIDTLKLGDEFFIELKSGGGVVVGDLSVIYESGWSDETINPDFSYGGYSIHHSFKISDGKNSKILDFSYSNENNAIENNGMQKWRGYKIEILDDFREPLRMKITKVFKLL